MGLRLYVYGATARRPVWERVCARLELVLEVAGDDDGPPLERREDLGAVLIDLPAGDQPLPLAVELAERRPDLPVLLALDADQIALGAEALRLDARGLVDRTASVDEMARTLARVLAEPRRVRRLPAPAKVSATESLLVGSSAAMGRLHDEIARLAQSQVSVLVTGESGTGKELVARALHACSPRRDAPLEAVNCAALPADLAENELFGHERGAYTDAFSKQQGLFVRARGGTVFLDEIGELPLGVQTKLLRVLQERVIRPVGGSREVEIDVRLVTATHRDLHADAEKRRFRPDLLYRIDVAHLHVPPLRERPEDVLVLARHFVARLAAARGRTPPRLAPSVQNSLVAHAWPGNVRELENCIERAMAVCRGDEILLVHLADALRGSAARRLRVGPRVTLDDAAHRHILRVLESCGGNKSKAAKVLGIPRRTLYRRLDGKDAS